MNRVHAAIIAHIRKSSAEEGGKVAQGLTALTDEQMMKMMFSSVRGKGDQSRGLRLTNAGLQMMQPYFRNVQIDLQEGRKLQTRELLYLDRRATLPYFCSNVKLVIFETELGMKLRLWDGDIARLAEIETL